jgi:signal transduction histidine kinase
LVLESRMPLNTKNRFKEFIIGKGNLPSRLELKRVVLTGYLSIVCIVVAIIYAVLDFVHDVYYSMPSYAVLFTMPIISLLLLRSGNSRAAKVSLMISVNMVVFWAAINDPFETGTFMFFIPTGIGSFAVLGFHEKKTGVALTALTTTLFLLAYFSNLQPFPVSRPSEDYIKLSFVLNYAISLTISVLVVYFLMNLNQLSEAELVEKERFAHEKNRELQKVNDELDRFVYSVSHDLRSPLSSILGLTNLARITKDPTELDEILSRIQSRVSAQDHFIKEIIDYSRNQRSDVLSEEVILDKLVDEIIDSLKYNSNADKITFRKKIPSGITLHIDRIRLSVVLNNLIGNAIKYHDLAKGTPFIEVGFAEDKYAIYVKDNGIGIPREHQEKIFDMFYRGSDRSTGSGLGLFISKEAVMKLNGILEVKSSQGEGSTFFVYLPAEVLKQQRESQNV